MNGIGIPERELPALADRQADLVGDGVAHFEIDTKTASFAHDDIIRRDEGFTVIERRTPSRVKSTTRRWVAGTSGWNCSGAGAGASSPSRSRW